MTDPISLRAKELQLPMRTTFKQASSVRNVGESIWCEANRGKQTGLGEGCPRKYVTGENLGGAMNWLNTKIPEIQLGCRSLPGLKEWINNYRSEIDENPAAFSAIEIALVELFAKEKKSSVEKLVGLNSPCRIYQYTGVLGDSSEKKYTAMAQRFFKMGFTDFKIKVNGALDTDNKKLKIVHQLAAQNNIPEIRIRLDANNLWKGNVDAAIGHLSKLDYPIFGIEEPVAPKNYEALEKISSTLGVAVILDESICNLNDLNRLDPVLNNYIANIKVSRIGGLLRSLELIDALKARDKKIIIGAHVGETSILTRAGMCAANAAGNHLVAQEGGFGLLLLEKEPVGPSLMIGPKGQIDLSNNYTIKTPEKIIEIPKENWSVGWGMRVLSGT
ncbi:MAG: enolase C-terminal domain-like protein [Bacteroidota bacterium]